jgi:uncharacterized cupin superfamily protein
MQDFLQGNEQRGLEQWPQFAELPYAKVIGGDPRQAARLDFGSLEGPLMSGVWECTPGKLEFVYPFSELCTFLEGKATVTDPSGRSVTYNAGDSFFIPQGEKVTWEVHERVRKCFFLHMGKP